MTQKKNRHIGSTFESWLDEVGLREEVTVAAIKSIIAQHVADEMKKRKLTKKRVAELLKIRQALADEVEPSFDTLAQDPAARRTQGAVTAFVIDLSEKTAGGRR
jgi:hypothetical protein